MTETIHVHLLQSNPSRIFKVVGTIANSGRWLDADGGHTLTSDGPGAVSGVLQFGSDDLNHRHFALAVGHDNNDPWCDLITGPPATQSAKSILGLYNPERVQGMIKRLEPHLCDPTSAELQVNIDLNHSIIKIGK